MGTNVTSHESLSRASVSGAGGTRRCERVAIVEVNNAACDLLSAAAALPAGSLSGNDDGPQLLGTVTAQCQKKSRVTETRSKEDAPESHHAIKLCEVPAKLLQKSNGGTTWHTGRHHGRQRKHGSKIDDDAQKN